MIKALVCIDSDLSKYNTDEIGFVQLSNELNNDTYFDVVVLNKQSDIKVLGDFEKLNKYIYKIVVVENETDLNTIGFKTDAWVLLSKLENICKPIKAGLSRINLAKEHHNANKILAQISANNDISNKSCDLILLNLTRATSQIKTIFEEQVNEIRSIHNDIKGVRKFLQDEYSPPSCSDVVSAASQTDLILTRTDEVIKAMFGFIRILQCEDRLSQMLGGLKNLHNLESDLIKQYGIELPHDELLKLASSLEALFTVQEQRDIAKGDTDLEKMITCGDVVESIPEEIELF